MDAEDIANKARKGRAPGCPVAFIIPSSLLVCCISPFLSMDRWKQCTHRLSDQQEQDGRLHLILQVHKSVLEGMFIHVVELLH